MEKFELYNDGYKSIKEGWTQGSFTDHKGAVCLVGSITEGRERDLSEETLADFHAVLKKYPFYRMVYNIEKLVVWHDERYPHNKLKSSWDFNDSRQVAVMAWNDMKWRRKKTVVKVMKKLRQNARKSEIELKVLQLETRIKELNTEIESLQTENTKLRGLLAFFTKKDDERTLKELSAELDSTWEELAGVKSFSALTGN